MSYWKPAAIIIAILSLILFSALTVNPLTQAGEKSGKSTAPDDLPPELRSKYIDLGEFLINLKGGYGGQYVKASISLKLDRSGEVPTVQAKIPEIRHHVNMVFQSQTADELSTYEGKLKLADAIREHVEYVMGQRKTLAAEGAVAQPIRLSAVSDVLFTSFIIH